ncbi:MULTISPECIES: protein kinase domain-containing protein [unclassified Streptomyces]|uniref:protein kinase domain-containing protein n=1 Tax=Streptomyces sp. NPDC127129 TaxID=3345373 RepID=UPI003631DC49
MIGDRIGDYVVVRLLGSGGMGSVYLARSPSGRPVAIKVVRAEYADDPRFRERFRKEVEAARRVGGFHTAAVVDADPDAPQPWMASAYVVGRTLAEEVQRYGPLDERRLWGLGAALAEALVAIHARGLVHRDLKPGNIVLADDGPRVLDFGIARALEETRLTSDGMVVGTPGFLAPEQAQGHEITGATDVFALGAVLVAAAGGRAFGEGEGVGLMFRAVHESEDLTALPVALRPVAAACLRKDPRTRPTPREVLAWCVARREASETSETSEAPETREASQATEVVPPVVTRPAPPAPPLPVASYRRRPRSHWAMILRNALGLLALVVSAVLNERLFHGPGGLTATLAAVSFLWFLRLVALLRTTNGLVLNGLGIGVGYLGSLTVLRWQHVHSLDLVHHADGARLTVRLTDDSPRPRFSPRPKWLHDAAGGALRIHGEALAPARSAAPLPDAVRGYATRHGVPLTETPAP